MFTNFSHVPAKVIFADCARLKFVQVNADLASTGAEHVSCRETVTGKPGWCRDRGGLSISLVVVVLGMSSNGGGVSSVSKFDADLRRVGEPRESRYLSNVVYSAVMSDMKERSIHLCTGDRCGCQQSRNNNHMLKLTRHGGQQVKTDRECVNRLS